MAKPKTKVDANTKRSIVARYGKIDKDTGKITGFAALAEQFKLGYSVLRGVLVEAGVTLRTQGRPAKLVEA